ncbi:MAG: TolC family protein [Planctomycetaceae bacterium]|nr:TolC family protein [Planctomycetaceae bacterium]
MPPEDIRPDHTEADLASGSVLTVDELEQIALTNNPTVQQAAAVVEKARGIRRQVGLYPNPTIGYSGEEIGDDGTAGKQGGFISQTIVTGGKLSLNRAVTDQEISNLIWELDAQRYRVRNSVRRQFYEALGAQRRVEVARELLGIVERGVETSEGLLKGQEVAKPDVLQAKIQFSEVRILLRNAEYDFEAAWKQLTSLIGQPQMPPTALAGSLEDGIPACEFEAVFAQLMSISPELQAARSRVARARVQIRRQEVQPIPNVLAQAGVSHDNASGDDLTSIQLGIPLPIFNRNQGNIHLAVAEHRRAVSDLRRLELSLRVRLADAFRDYSQAQNQVSQYRNQILPTARENLDLTEEGYRAGEFDLIRVLTARRSVIEANLAYIRSLVSARQAHVEITGLLLTGGLNDIPDAVGSNLEGIGLRDETLSSQ